MASVTKGISTLTWGNGSVTVTGYQLVSFDQTKEGKTVDALSPIGEEIARRFYGEKTTTTVEAYVLTATTLPSRGDTVAVNGVNHYVDSVTRVSTNEDFQRVRMNLTNLPGTDFSY